MPKFQVVGVKLVEYEYQFAVDANAYDEAIRLAKDRLASFEYDEADYRILVDLELRDVLEVASIGDD